MMRDMRNAMRGMLYIILIGGLAFIAGCSSKPSTISKGEDVSKEKMETEMNILVARKSAFKPEKRFIGSVRPERVVMVTSQVPGTLISLGIEEGMTLKKDDIIGVVDTSLLVSQKNVILQQLSFAEDIMARRERLYREKAISEVEYLSARNQVDVLRRQLEQVETQLKNAIIRAPFDCIVDEVMVKVGGWVSPGIPIARLLSTEKWSVVVSVPDRMLSSMDENWAPRLIINGDTITGRVRYFSRWISPENRTFNIYIDIPRGVAVASNQNVDVFLREKEIQGFFIPANVLRYDSREYVLVRRNGQIERKNVNVIESRGDSIFVEGLVDGDTIIWGTAYMNQ